MARSISVPSACCSGAASHRLTYSRTQGNSQTEPTALSIKSHGTESKNALMSRSTTQSYFQHRSRHVPTASIAPRPGR